MNPPDLPARPASTDLCLFMARLESLYISHRPNQTGKQRAKCSGSPLSLSLPLPLLCFSAASQGAHFHRLPTKGRAVCQQKINLCIVHFTSSERGIKWKQDDPSLKDDA